MEAPEREKEKSRRRKESLEFLTFAVITTMARSGSSMALIHLSISSSYSRMSRQLFGGAIVANIPSRFVDVRYLNSLTFAPVLSLPRSLPLPPSSFSTSFEGNIFISFFDGEFPDGEVLCVFRRGSDFGHSGCKKQK